MAEASDNGVTSHQADADETGGDAGETEPDEAETEQGDHA
jgi:hypothetical protein